MSYSKTYVEHIPDEPETPFRIIQLEQDPEHKSWSVFNIIGFSTMLQVENAMEDLNDYPQIERINVPDEYLSPLWTVLADRLRLKSQCEHLRDSIREYVHYRNNYSQAFDQLEYEASL